MEAYICKSAPLGSLIPAESQGDSAGAGDLCHQQARRARRVARIPGDVPELASFPDACPRRVGRSGRPAAQTRRELRGGASGGRGRGAACVASRDRPAPWLTAGWGSKQKPRGPSPARNANSLHTQLKSLGPGVGRRVSTDFGRSPPRPRPLPRRAARAAPLAPGPARPRLAACVWLPPAWTGVLTCLLTPKAYFFPVRLWVQLCYLSTSPSLRVTLWLAFQWGTCLVTGRARLGYKTRDLCDLEKKSKEEKQQLCLFGLIFLWLGFPPPPPSPALTTVRTSVLENELTLYNLSMYLIHSGCGVAYVVTCFGSVSLNTTWDCGQITSLRGTLYLCFKNARCFHRDLTISSGLLGSPCSSGTGKRQIRYSYFTAWENKAEFRKLP